MTLEQDIRLRSLRSEAQRATKHMTLGDIRAMTEVYHTDVWYAVRLMCEALLGDEDANRD